ncbi:hypothetical protein NBRC116187_18160 [Halopseudomonas sabulinigri]|uniref:Uncharacterized protein n=1 Tax=Halopseudomonas sabulinigri TaxID=472181 RepID=A0ABP9ZPR1_9GAMM
MSKGARKHLQADWLEQKRLPSGAVGRVGCSYIKSARRSVLLISNFALTASWGKCMSISPNTP